MYTIHISRSKIPGTKDAPPMAPTQRQGRVYYHTKYANIVQHHRLP